LRRRDGGESGGKTFAAVAASRKKKFQTLIDVPNKLGFRFAASSRTGPCPAISPNKGNRIASACWDVIT
jgi:hypothetical protein